MKYIRMDLEKDRLSENAPERVVIDFFYSDRGGDVQRGHQWMLRSLLYQLLRARRDMWDIESILLSSGVMCLKTGSSNHLNGYSTSS
jgi:hypothetical protein